MPSTNHFKFGASGISSATRSGFKVGVKGGADYGPTSTNGFYNGITPPVGGYTIYVDKASQGPSIHVANDDTQCIFFLKSFGATGSTISDVLDWAAGQANMAVLSAELTLTDLPIAPGTYSVGQEALGGYVYYILQPGDTGYDAGAQHGLVVRTTPIADDNIYSAVSSKWGCQGTSVSTSTALGTGNQNTINIMAACAGTYISARLLGGLVQGGYSDWYLPSKDELNKLYLVRNTITTLDQFRGAYWSSSQSDADNAWVQYMRFGQQQTSLKSNDGFALPVRSF